ncbi:hypothetical protein BDP27DRAFT_785205 [Rhodocollybia butyracea]|uniref:Uncharacterized protein n=1 Tax=Rhodocollybia butyracea TaxID=206335 RepID=A0A9P5U682_9AGAR|nr:hypothetical protein BDP27DRAFT_785205 [Rhodocollybia butyracea]
MLMCFFTAHRTSTSTSSYTASHYARRKRVRLSSGTSFATTQNISETGSRVAPSRDGSYRHPPPPTNGSVRPSSRDSRTPTQSSFRGGSVSSHQHSVRFTGQPQRVRGPSSTVGSSRRNSVSQTSIPLSALVSPHAPSISIHRATPYHMRDPRKPSPVHPTSWSLTFPSPGPEERSYFSGCVNGMTCCWGVGGLLERLFQRDGKQLGGDPEKQVVEQEESGGKLQVVDWIEGGGSPIHAWLFFLGFIFFPSWWIAGLFVGIPKTRRLGAGTPGEKSVVLDDPQVEHGTLISYSCDEVLIQQPVIFQMQKPGGLDVVSCPFYRCSLTFPSSFSLLYLSRDLRGTVDCARFVIVDYILSGLCFVPVVSDYQSFLHFSYFNRFPIASFLFSRIPFTLSFFPLHG